MAHDSLKLFLTRHGASKFKELSSGDLNCTCPFHNERRPSFGVKIDRKGYGMYQCFGCGVKGSIWDLVKELEPYNVTVRDTIEDFANDSPIYKLEDSPNVKPMVLMEEDYDRFAILHDYWYMRGVNLESIKRFKLGYCPERWSVTLPVRSFDSFDLIGVCFRLIDTHPSFPSELKVKQQAGFLPKYSYLNGTRPKFSLFGIDCIRNKKDVYLFEGPIDAINFMQRNPEKQALAKYGRGLSKFQIAYLSKFQTVFIVQDNDEAGEQIALNTRIALNHVNVNCGILRIDNNYKDYTESVVSGITPNLIYV